MVEMDEKQLDELGEQFISWGEPSTCRALEDCIVISDGEEGRKSDSKSTSKEVPAPPCDAAEITQEEQVVMIQDQLCSEREADTETPTQTTQTKRQETPTPTVHQPPVKPPPKTKTLCRHMGRDEEDMKRHMYGVGHRKKFMENKHHDTTMKLPEPEPPNSLPETAYIQREFNKIPHACIGLQFIVEHHAKGYEPVYYCEVCSTATCMIVECPKYIILHVKSPAHRKKYMEKHYPKILDDHRKELDILPTKHHKAHLELVSYNIEQQEGRQEVKVGSNRTMFKHAPFKKSAVESRMIGVKAPPAYQTDPRNFIFENDKLVDFINFGCHALEGLGDDERLPNPVAKFESFEDYITSRTQSADDLAGPSPKKKMKTMHDIQRAANFRLSKNLSGGFAQRGGAAKRGGAAQRGGAAAQWGKKAQRGAKNKSWGSYRDQDYQEDDLEPLPPDSPGPSGKLRIQDELKYFQKHLRDVELDSRDAAEAALKVSNILITKLNIYQSKHGVMEDANLKPLMGVKSSSLGGPSVPEPSRKDHHRPPPREAETGSKAPMKLESVLMMSQFLKQMTQSLGDGKDKAAAGKVPGTELSHQPSLPGPPMVPPGPPMVPPGPPMLPPGPPMLPPGPPMLPPGPPMLPTGPPPLPPHMSQNPPRGDVDLRAVQDPDTVHSRGRGHGRGHGHDHNFEDHANSGWYHEEDQEWEDDRGYRRDRHGWGNRRDREDGRGRGNNRGPRHGFKRGQGGFKRGQGKRRFDQI